MKLFLVVLGCLFVSANVYSGNLRVANFAIYNTHLDGNTDGVWKPEVEALKRMLSLFGWSYREVGPEEIRLGVLGEGQSLQFNALIMPGGFSDPRQIAIGADGKRNIENFIKSGGTYLGFCAGSFYASQHVEWADQSRDPEGRVNLKGDYNTEHNELSPDLLPGRAIGPMQWVPWKVGGTRAAATGFAPVRINLEIQTLKEIGLPEVTELFYFGGPYFDIQEEKKPKDLEIWARAIRPRSSGGRMLGEDQPTIIKYGLGRGKVILFSYHPIVIGGGQLDGIQITNDITRMVPTVYTNPTQLDSNRANYHSWNILYAALRIATHMQVQAMPNVKEKLMAHTSVQTNRAPFNEPIFPR